MRFAVVPAHGSPILVVCVALLSACGSRTPLDFARQHGSFVPSPDSLDSGLPSQCLTASQLVGEIPIDLYFMMDKSTSMNTFDHGQSMSRWLAVSHAMKTFITSPESDGLSAGIAFFPRTDPFGNPLCGAPDYAFPVVPLDTIPDVVPAISTGISAQVLAPGTPTTPALQGAHIYAREQAQAGRVTAVVIVTDGQPRQCGSTIETTAAVAMRASGGNPSIKTYVLGVGPSLSALNAIAQAGGTGQAYLVESGGETELNAALDAIRRSASSCAYVIPAEGRKPADQTPAKVAIRIGMSGAPIFVGQVSSQQDCGNGAGWYYERSPTSGDGPTETSPTRITLCPASCDSVVNTSGSHLDVEVGCEDAGASPL